MKMMRFFLLISLCLSPITYAEGFLDRLPLLGGAQKPTFLDPDKAFKATISVRSPQTLVAHFKIAPGYYLYRNQMDFKLVGNLPSAANVKIANVSMPQGEMKNDPNFGDVEVYHQSFPVVITLERLTKAAQQISVEVNYQGCSEKGLCYPPITKRINVMLTVVIPIMNRSPLKDAALSTAPAPSTPVPAATTQPSPQSAADADTPGDTPQNENSRIVEILKQGSFWLVVSSFFAAGLLLAFTPCMFPMLPILSGIIVGRGHHVTHLHGFILSLAYVLGMALTYAAVGVAAGFSGTLLSTALQNPWVLSSFAAVFVLLSLSMFGFYELQLPSALQSRLANTSNKLHGGHLSGVFAMGALSAIIVGPCVAAPLAAALMYIGQTHDAVLGGVALFALAMGMGLPLLLIGASAGTLLPKAGAWMESVKRFFGVLLLAVAIWLISSLIPVSIQMLLWAVLLILSAVHLHALDALPHTSSGMHRLWKGIGILALLLGIAYLIGALSGARDILRPLGSIGSAQAEMVPHLPFIRIKNTAELDARIAQANGKPVVLDFYADWCVSCKEMERYTFSDPNVRAKLGNVLLLQADVTANSADDKALLQRFGLFGPPAILFFGLQGQEKTNTRVTGYEDAQQFLQSLERAGL